MFKVRNFLVAGGCFWSASSHYTDQRTEFGYEMVCDGGIISGPLIVLPKRIRFSSQIPVAELNELRNRMAKKKTTL